MSSLVLTADRSKIPRRDNEPTGEPETLVGRIDPKSMGSRAFKESVHIKKDISKKKSKHITSNEDRPKKFTETNSRRYADVIEAIQEIEGLTYKPRTNETRSIYELLLSSVQLMLGDQPNEIVRSATDMTIEAMKNDNDYPKDLDKKRTIEEFLGTISSEKFNELSNLAKKLTDYGDDDQAQQAGGEGGDGENQKRANELDDDNNGVAVVFEDDENGEDSDEDEFEIRDNSDSDEDSEADENQDQDDNDLNAQQIDPTDQIIIGPDSNNALDSKNKKGKQDLTIYDIDGFWLQRLIGSHFPDPIEAESKTKEAINLLSADNSSLRDLENSLVDLFDYDKFELVSVLTKHRDIIVWGTKWSRSDEDEKVNLAVVMREKGVGWIVKALTTGRGINNPQLQATGNSNNKMDIDSESTKPTQFPTKANLEANSFLPNPKKVLDLSSMVFNQGSRTMTNKKCKLPEGSHKVPPTGQGYEEIHVPPPEKAPVKAEDLVKIVDLPHWSREAFKGATTLNRVQSKVFPVAFGQDDPILLCAPTGAGKVKSLLHLFSNCI
jgi:pre-mRNA-splicing helicase BRR2